VNYVDQHGIVKFVNWMVLTEKKEGVLPYYDRLFAGISIQSVLASANDAQDIKNALIHRILNEVYYNRQQITLPYPLPFGQAHCVCCRWSYPFSSACAVLPSCSTHLTYFTSRGPYNQLGLAASETAYIDIDYAKHPTGPLRSSVFTIQPGWKPIWCGLQAGHDSRLLQYMQFFGPRSEHTDYIQCKPASVILCVCRS
jgi:hypothetical protein